MCDTPCSACSSSLMLLLLHNAVAFVGNRVSVQSPLQRCTQAAVPCTLLHSVILHTLIVWQPNENVGTLDHDNT